MFWTHAIARDYEEMERVMEVLPDSVIQVRHYQGHWYKNNNLLETMEEKFAPLPKTALNLVAEMKTKGIKQLYMQARDAAKTAGVEWVTPVERPRQFHHDL